MELTLNAIGVEKHETVEGIAYYGKQGTIHYRESSIEKGRIANKSGTVDCIQKSLIKMHTKH
jgi:hypothetical protein